MNPTKIPLEKLGILYNLLMIRGMIHHGMSWQALWRPQTLNRGENGDISPTTSEKQNLLDPPTLHTLLHKGPILY